MFEVAQFWILLCIGCAVWAGRLNRSAFGYFVLAFVLSPVVCALVLLHYGPQAAFDPVTGNTLRRRICPFCREDVHVDAVLCKHCHSKLDA